MKLNPRAETRLKQVEGLLEEVCDCFWTELDSEGNEQFVTEDVNGNYVAVSTELEAIIVAAQKVLFDELDTSDTTDEFSLGL